MSNKDTLKDSRADELEARTEIEQRREGSELDENALIDIELELDAFLSEQEYEHIIETLGNLVESIQEVIDNNTAVEFPRMFGWEVK